jgi:hypothetical protein
MAANGSRFSRLGQIGALTWALEEMRRFQKDSRSFPQLRCGLVGRYGVDNSLMK